MNNAPAILRTLIIYAVIVPLAILIGYLLTDPIQFLGRDTSSMAFIAVLVLLIISPLMLKWHHLLLIFCLNSGLIIGFLPGRPEWWLGMTVVSLTLSVLHRTLGGVNRLVSVPQVTWSLIFMIAVVLFTAKMTGFGLHSSGSEISGGRRYVSLLGAIMVYFALSVQRIPRERAHLYVALFFLPTLVQGIGDFLYLLPPALRYIYLIFPTTGDMLTYSPLEKDIRFYGGMVGSIAIFSYMQARYGLRGIFLSGKSWRWMILILAFGYGLLGAFRSGIAFIVLIFGLQFLIEGLYRTKLLAIFAALGVLGAIALIPLAPHLPRTAQRALAFLPLDVDLQVRKDAQNSADWRFEMWKALIPQIPQYLLLGKGYVISRRDIDMQTGEDAAIQVTFSENQYMALAGGYHSGPLSVILTFGIWGAITMIWFWIAGVWVLYRNYRYGNPALKTINTFLLVVFVARIILFLSIFGDFAADMLNFGGYLGFSVALNGGVCSPAPAPVREVNRYPSFAAARAHLQPALRRPNIQG